MSKSRRDVIKPLQAGLRGGQSKISTETRHYGQIIRGTNGVYTIWDLRRKVGLSAFLKSHSYYRVGELITFVLDENEVIVTTRNFEPKKLPEGLEPLIAVPAGPSSPDPDKKKNDLLISALSARASYR